MVRFVDTATNTPIPFAIIQIEDSLLLSNIKGELIINSNYQGPIIIKEPICKTANLYFRGVQDSVYNLTPILFQQPKRIKFDSTAIKLINEIALNKSRLEPYALAPFDLDTYNKFTLSTSSNRATGNSIQKILGKVGLRINDFKNEQHLIISETTTHLRYKNKLKQDEQITSIKISGIEQPVLSSVNSFFQSFSDFVEI